MAAATTVVLSGNSGITDISALENAFDVEKLTSINLSLIEEGSVTEETPDGKLATGENKNITSWDSLKKYYNLTTFGGAPEGFAVDEKPKDDEKDESSTEDKSSEADASEADASEEVSEEVEESAEASVEESTEAAA